MPLHPVLLEKLNATLAPASPPPLTRRDARLPAVPGKVHAVIGMRRAGKTSFLRQLQAARRESLPPERTVFVSFDHLALGLRPKPDVRIENDHLGCQSSSGTLSK